MGHRKTALLAICLLVLGGCGEGLRDTGVSEGFQFAVPASSTENRSQGVPLSVARSLIRPRLPDFPGPFDDPDDPNDWSDASLAKDLLGSEPVMVQGPPPILIHVASNFGILYDINNHGQAVGMLHSPPWAPDMATFFVWDEVAGPQFVVPPSVQLPTGIDDNGTIVGIASIHPSETLVSQEAFRWNEQSGLMLLGAVGGDPSAINWCNSAAFAVNATGGIVGESTDLCEGLLQPRDSPGFGAPIVGAIAPNSGGKLLSAGGLGSEVLACSYPNGNPYFLFGHSQLVSVNSKGHAVGSSLIWNCDHTQRQRAWAPTNGGDITPSNAVSAQAVGINDSDTIVGNADVGDGARRVFLLQAGGPSASVGRTAVVNGLPAGSMSSVYLSSLNGSSSAAIDINNNGYVVGVADLVLSGRGERHGVVWRPDGSIIDLGLGAYPQAINDQNTVVGEQQYVTFGEYRWYPAVWKLPSITSVTIADADLVTNSVTVTLAGPSMTMGVLSVVANGESHIYAAKTSLDPVGTGTYRLKFDRPHMPIDTYGSLTATWDIEPKPVVATLALKDNWQVLGVIRHSQYNTPTESKCKGGTVSAWVFDDECHFVRTDLKAKFVSQVFLNGHGNSISHGLLAYESLRNRFNPCLGKYPAGANARNAFLKVSSLVGSCLSSLVGGVSVATYPNPRPGAPDAWMCGDVALLVSSLDANVALKKAADYCPACVKDFRGTDGHIDNYSAEESCSARSVLDLGNFWTANTHGQDH